MGKLLVLGMWRVGGAASGSGAVLVVGDVVEPGHDLTVLVGLLDGDVRHEPVGRGAVPVLLAGLDVDDVAGMDLLHVTTAAGDVADAVGDVQGLPAGVGVPGGPGSGGEADVGAADGRLLVGVADAVDVDGAGEPVRQTGRRLGAASRVLHGLPLAAGDGLRAGS